MEHQCRKTTVLSCHECLINTGDENINNNLNIDKNFGHQMSLSKSKYCDSNSCLLFKKFH